MSTALDPPPTARAAPSAAGGPAPQRRRSRHLVLPLGPYRVRAERRALVTACVLCVALVLLCAVALTLGDYGIGVAEIPGILLGDSSDELATYFVRDVRLPRVAAAVLVGAALGMSGAIFQSLSANPLGSPDIIGFTTGSATGALVLIVTVGAAPDQVALGAVLGGAVTAAAVYAMSYRRGVTATRLVLVGVGVGAMLQAANSLLIVRASLPAAQAAGVWLAGSLNSVQWDRVTQLAVAVAVLAPCAMVLARSLGPMMLGDDVATGLGVRVERSRLGLVVVGVGLVAVAVATGGPIAFVALAAPQLARRLTRTAGVGVGTAALMGSVVVVASDIVAQRIFAPTQLPVGVVTGTLGGTYLIWLLIWRWRGRR